MTRQEHEPTPQETELYEAMTAGDWDTVDGLRDAAYTADQTPPVDKETGLPPEGWLSPAEQFDEDYAAAHARYQADHEMPQDDREDATVEQVAEENTTAREAAG